MKELTGTASASTPASPEACIALLAAVDRYPSWHPDVVKAVEVLERDDQGQPTKAQTKLHVQHGPITRDFDLTMAVVVDPAGTVKLSRIPHHGSDGEKFEVNWRVSGGGSEPDRGSTSWPTSTFPGSSRSAGSATRWPRASSARRLER